MIRIKLLTEFLQLMEFSNDVFQLLGNFEIDMNEQAEPQRHHGQNSIAIVTESTVSAIAIMLLQKVDDFLDELLEVFGLQKHFSSKNFEVDNRKIEQMVDDKLNKISSILINLLQCPLYELADLTFRTCTKLFKVLAVHTSQVSILFMLDRFYNDKPQWNAIEFDCEKWDNMIALIAGRLIKNIYAFMSYVNQIDMAQSRQAKTSTIQIVRKTRALPSLVFQIEQFEAENRA
jgi:hypothetical protein